MGKGEGRRAWRRKEGRVREGIISRMVVSRPWQHWCLFYRLTCQKSVNGKRNKQPQCTLPPPQFLSASVKSPPPGQKPPPCRLHMENAIVVESFFCVCKRLFCCHRDVSDVFIDSRQVERGAFHQSCSQDRKFRDRDQGQDQQCQDQDRDRDRHLQDLDQDLGLGLGLEDAGLGLGLGLDQDQDQVAVHNKMRITFKLLNMLSTTEDCNQMTMSTSTHKLFRAQTVFSCSFKNVH